MTGAHGAFFSGGGGAKSLNYGKTHDTTFLNKVRGGKITNIGAERQQTHITTGAPQFQKDGVTPKNELPVTMLCDGGGPQLRAAYAAGDAKVVAFLNKYGGPLKEFSGDPADDMRRTMYVKGTATWAIGEHLRENGIDPSLFAVGAELYMVWTAMRKIPNTEFDGRDWEVLFFPPVPGSQAGGFFNDHPNTGTPAADAPATQHVAAPSAPPAPPADPFGGAAVPQQGNQAPAQGSPFGGTSAAPPAQVPAQATNNPFA
jgi:hypothetical protein